MNQTAENQTNTLSNVAVGIAVIIVILALILFVRKRRKAVRCNPRPVNYQS